MAFQKRNCKWSVAQICRRVHFKFQKICWYFVSYLHANCAKLSLSCCEIESQPKEISTQMPFSNALFSNLLTQYGLKLNCVSGRGGCYCSSASVFFPSAEKPLLLLLLLVLLLPLHDGRAIASCKGIFGMKRLKPLTRKGKYDKVDKGEMGPHNRRHSGARGPQTQK